MGKKYFWLKLKEDFFMQKEIKKLRKIAGGDTYTIIYLKLQLLSIRNEGKIIYEGTEENLVEQLALEIDEDPDNIKVLLLFLEKNKLIEEIEENEFLLVRASECIGKESDSAERVRRHRENKRLKDDKDKKALPGNAKVTICNTEKEKDKEKDKEINLKTEIEIEKMDNSQSRLLDNTDIFKHFEHCGFRLSPLQFEEIVADVEVYSKQWLIDAATLASNRGKFSYSYVRGILNNWLSEGRKDSEEDGSSKQNNGKSSKYKDYDFSFNRRSGQGNEDCTGDGKEINY